MKQMKHLSTFLIIALLFTMLFAVSTTALASIVNPFDEQDNKEVPYNGGLYFDISEDDTLNSVYKPKISIDQIEYDSSSIPYGKEIAVNVFLSGNVSGKWCACGLHIGYDTRLTIKHKAHSDQPYYVPGDAASELSTIITQQEPGLFFITSAGAGDYGEIGIMYTFYFTLPENAKAGDVYPIGIYYDAYDSHKDVFNNEDMDFNGEAMQSYLFYKGITNGYIKIKSSHPTITSQPMSKTINAGESATFSVSATGSGLSYQWQYRTSNSGTWNPITNSDFSTGWASSVLSINSSSTSGMDGYQFRCVVSNSGGSVISDIATLTVKPSAPTITSQPMNKTVYANESASFSVSASGSNLSYQWQYRTSSSGTWGPITNYDFSSGWDSNYLSISSYATSNMNGYQFRCVVSNDAGSVTSNTATLTVIKPITSAAITITNPAAGAKPDYNPGLPANAHFYLDNSYQDSTSINDVSWFDETAERWLDTTDTFIAGHVYYFRVELTPEEGYTFTSDFTATVNGKAAEAELRDSVDGDYMRVSYTFPALSDSGWKQNSNGWWYLRADGTYPKNEWEKINGKWYHFDTKGYMQTGWQKISGSWYYLGISGAMQTGWQKISNQWYYFNSSGVMQTGWQKISNQWFYLNSSGVMQTGWQKISNQWYYFNSSGVMQTGWQTISGKTYFLKASGVMAANEWCGGWWLNQDGTWTYKYKASWRQNSKGWWFGDDSGWYAKDTTYKIDGKNYKFDKNGYWVK